MTTDRDTLREKLKGLFIDYGYFLVIGGTIELDELLDSTIATHDAALKDQLYEQLKSKRRYKRELRAVAW